ncbi:MAG: hypothetical protein M3P50_03870, partial [Actinomycetota bacterium]|nr:hypothetical protein [Actinomycetota bacterium]
MSRRDGRARFFAVLGLPAFALSLGVTTVSGLLPVLLHAEGGPLVAGALVALEGVFALVVPPLIGPLTDRMGGRRLPFVAGGAVLAVAGLVLVAAAGSFAGLVLGLVVFQIAYFACLTPYFALFGDV